MRITSESPKSPARIAFSQEELTIVALELLHAQVDRWTGVNQLNVLALHSIIQKFNSPLFDYMQAEDVRRAAVDLVDESGIRSSHNYF